MIRLFQVMQYGSRHATQIAKENNFGCIKKCSVFIDILSCYCKYRMWSNQYLKERFWELPAEERKRLGAIYLEKGLARDAWQKRFQSDKRLYAKYGMPKYELGRRRRAKRTKAYQEHYGAGEGLFVESDVQICQQHYLNGSIKIGKNVVIAKHVFIDYSGELEIRDGAKLAAGVSIETHHRDLEAFNQGQDVNIGTKLVIGEKAYIGTHVIILDSCNYIGKCARIGAGAVVVKDIPDYAVAVGVPAKVVKVMDH